MMANKRYLLSLFAIVLVATVVLCWLISERDPEANLADELSDSISQSTVVDDPVSLQYVGLNTCGECHGINFGFHRESGHANTLRPAIVPEVRDKFLGHELDRYGLGDIRYQLDEEGLSATLEDVMGDRPFPLDYAFGSGHNAITLVTLVPDEQNQTVGFEHCNSWFAATEALAQTPGQSSEVPVHAAEFFGQQKNYDEVSRCFDCHTTTSKIELNEPAISQLRPNVNCERCHGPGSEHVRAARASNHPPAFSVHRADWTRSDEINLCGSCHRMPEEFSPARLREYPPMMARFQPIGLLRSRCLLESDELRCTTCHNPHQRSTVRSPEAYEQICINCHRPDTINHVVCPVSPTADCIRCHMPRVAFAEGISFHDHWIRVRKPSENTNVAPEIPRGH